jgi:hypothetical protein
MQKNNKKLIIESGIRDINNIAKRYNKAKIYFHQDLDGVTSGLGMKKYLEDNGIKVVDAEIIQYGDQEWAIKKPEASGGVMPVLVDFAHGKPMFLIHTDHHDSQSGVEGDTSTSFKSARSNVETISGILSPKDLFPSGDIKLISTVDSANFRAMGISIDDVNNYIFNLDKGLPVEKNKMLMGLVTNKLLLAFKNKKGFLERLVLECEPSLISILNKIKQIMKEEGWSGVEELQVNREKYIEQMRGYGKKSYEDGIIIKDGGGSMIKPGSYDRYVSFKLHPDADFQVITWGSVGLLQVSCNPFKEQRGLKGIDLGEINRGILEGRKDELEQIKITANRLKKVAETSKKFVPGESVGFTAKDLVAFYGNTLEGYNEIPRKFENFLSKKYPDYERGLEEWKKIVNKTMSKPYVELSEFELAVLNSIYTTAYDVIKNNSGGHKCITNFQTSALGGGFGPYKTTDFIKEIKDEFVQILKDRINAEKGDNVNENYFRNIIKKTMKG